jgi:hypothetical protein
VPLADTKSSRENSKKVFKKIIINEISKKMNLTLRMLQLAKKFQTFTITP